MLSSDSGFERAGDFEIHVGFSNQDMRLADQLPLAMTWVLATVQEVVTPAHGRGMYEGHDVPGPLGLLATARFTTLGSALEGVNEVGRCFRGQGQIRIEVEEVLLTHIGPEPPEIIATPDCVIGHGILTDAELILDSPPFEIHFGLCQEDYDHPLGVTTQAVVERLGDDIHEAVRFSSKNKITTTTFYTNLSQMRRSCRPLADRVRTAISDMPLKIKVVAERIVLCAAPNR
jgi:hypothetical protein